MQKDWRDTIKQGDVLYENSDPKRPRLVRRVTYKGEFIRSVVFSIKRCSWTGRCYTVVGRTDLAYRKFTKSGVRITKLKTKLDAEIGLNIDNKEVRTLDCCAVRGVI